MKAITKKLNNRSGASIMIAMIFLILCATIGGIMLTRASTNAGKLAHLHLEQQNYFTISSAARLVREEIENSSFTVLETVEKYTKDGESEPTASLEKTSFVYSATSCDSLRDIIKNMATQCFENAPTITSYTFSVKVDGYDDVTGKISMDSNYNILIDFFIDDPQNAYTLLLTCNASVPHVVGPETVITNNVFLPTGPTDLNGIARDEKYSLATIKTSTEIKWQSGLISKPVL